MTYRDTLVEIINMPSLATPKVTTPWPDQTNFSRVQGIILESWTHWIDHIECRGQFLDVLVHGRVVRFWRPEIEELGHKEDFNLGDPGFWEVAGEASQSYEILPVQCTITE